MLPSQPAITSLNVPPPHTHTPTWGRKTSGAGGGGGVNNNMPERRQPARQSCSDWLGSGWRLAQLTNISHQAWRRLHTHAAFCGKTMGCSLRFWGTEIQGTANAPRTDHNARQLCGSHRHPGNTVKHRNLMRAENLGLMWISGAAEEPVAVNANGVAEKLNVKPLKSSKVCSQSHMKHLNA